MKLLIVLLVACFISNICAQSRIAGGAVTDISQYPFASALLNNLGGTAFQHVCSGTVLSTTAILSAASCFIINNQTTSESAWRARVGSTYSETLGLLYFVSRITTHPLFESATRDYDVAVIRTVVTIVLSATVQPAYIAGGAYRLNTNDEVVAIGWGATSATGPPSPELRHVQLWLNDQDECVERYKTVNFTVTDSMLCAGWLHVGTRGQCDGDTGGPLLHNNVVVGVFSWSQGCADPMFLGINTRVAPISRWIEAIATA